MIYVLAAASSQPTFLSQENLLSIGLKLLYCVVIIFLGFGFSFLSKKAAKHFAFKKDEPLPGNRNQKLYTVYIFIFSIARYFIYFLLAIILLSVFNAPINSIFLAFAGVGSVAVGFGSQTFVKDVISGLFILMEDQYGVGDKVTINNFTGTVEAIGIRTTKIRSSEGSLSIIPNGEIKTVVNMAKAFSRAVIDIKFGTGQDDGKIVNLLNEEMEHIGTSIEHLKDVPKVLGIEALDEKSFTIRITADCMPLEHYAVEREIRKRIKRMLEKNGILTV